MTGTPRKTAPRKAQPKKVAPAVVSAVPAVEDDDAFDLLSVLGKSGGDPRPIKLLGIRGNVFREFTGEQAIEFSALITKHDYLALLNLITDCGDELWEKISPLAPQYAAELLNALVNQSGLHEGKLFAFSLPSMTGQAGTPPSPDSDASTTV